MPIYRVRRYSGTKGGSHYYYHADIIARSPASALKAAREDRVRNWRWIDSFDVSDTTYCKYELLYRVEWRDAQNAAEPKYKTVKEAEEAWQQALKAHETWLANRNRRKRRSRTSTTR